MSDTSVPRAHLIYAASRFRGGRAQARRWFLLILAIALPAAAADLEVDARDVVARRCLGCHGPKSKVAGLDLSTRETALKGGSKLPGELEFTRALVDITRGAEPARVAT